MKKRNSLLPLIILALGLLGLMLRLGLYKFGMDGRELLVENHIFQILCWVLTVLTGLFLGWMVLPLDGVRDYEANFPASLPGGLGCFAAALGIVLTVAPVLGGYRDILATLWLIAGALAAVGLVVCGICRIRGEKPFFVFPSPVFLFFALHLANQYRVWSGEPQTTDYSYQLLACVCLTLFSYYCTAFTEGLGRRRIQLFSGLGAVYLCCLALARTDSPWLYLGCGAWALLNLCTLQPPRRRRRPVMEQPEPEVE